MCCPGCFSLYRAGAIRDVMAYYAGPTDHPFDVFVKDTGEDNYKLRANNATYLQKIYPLHIFLIQGHISKYKIST